MMGTKDVKAVHEGHNKATCKHDFVAVHIRPTIVNATKGTTEAGGTFIGGSGAIKACLLCGTFEVMGKIIEN